MSRILPTDAVLAQAKKDRWTSTDDKTTGRPLFFSTPLWPLKQANYIFEMLCIYYCIYCHPILLLKIGTV